MPFDFKVPEMPEIDLSFEGRTNRNRKISLPRGETNNTYPLPNDAIV